MTINGLQPGAPLLFMKVGTHANEGLGDILKRKKKEIQDGGFAMWGYGGSTCHPLSVVRPFAEMFQRQSEPIRLVMEEIDSHHFAEQIAADQYSVDGHEWIDIDTRVHQVLGSRYALFINNLRLEDIRLPLEHSRVALGACEGRRGDEYVKGRVDKACLIYDPTQSQGESTVKKIGLVADIVTPYAALLRNRSINE
jgi:hypothetical protein